MSAPIYDVQLQVEDPTDSGNWITAPLGVLRIPGQSSHFRIFYSLINTSPGTFNSINIYVKFEQTAPNISDITNVILPAGATMTKRLDATGLAVYFILGSAVPPTPGSYIYFTITSVKPGGPDGLVITSRSSISGKFVDDTQQEYSLSLNRVGPTWTVTIPVTLQKTSDKTVVLPGQEIIYYITLTNKGDDPYQNAILTDDVQDALTNAEYSLDNGATWSAWNGNCTLGDLPPNSITVIMIRGTIVQNA